FPFAAALRFHSAAFAGSTGTPNPRSYINARSRCARGSPCSAALVSHISALSSRPVCRARRGKSGQSHTERAHNPRPRLPSTGGWILFRLVAHEGQGRSRTPMLFAPQGRSPTPSFAPRQRQHRRVGTRPTWPVVRVPT